MNKIDVVKKILGDRYGVSPKHSHGKSFAPTNIALVKYWGKRNLDINLPVTPSLSISLDTKGAETAIKLANSQQDIIYLNGEVLDRNTGFSQRLTQYLDLFRQTSPFHFEIQIKTNIPIAAGLASSACGFAALIKSMDGLFGWNLALTELSILARLGSGSASRSLWHGFVEWQLGLREDGMDSYGVPIQANWSDFCVGLLIMQTKEKSVSSREAMKRTTMTSALYSAWPGKVQRDLALTKQAIQDHDFGLLGKTAESNAMTMHGLMLSAWPSITYALPETISAMQQVWYLRNEGLSLFFTQDAGPNLKLLFLENELSVVKSHFPEIEIVKPFICS